MATVKMLGIQELNRALKAEVKKLEQEAVEETRKAAEVVTEAFFDRTPVWMGTTIRNYAWGRNRMPTGGEKRAVGSGSPGPTNSMALGSEPRRGANEAAVIAQMSATIGPMRRLSSLYFTNLVNSGKWDLVDSGSAPTPDRARNPGGVSHIAIQTARSQLRNWK
jgi:hypothetical protein